jgi:50S ribosomal protein L16 3-hydroxylase
MPRPAISVLTHLGRLPVEEFMRRYWQRRPLLVRGALADLGALPTRAELAELAQRQEVEARLVTRFAGRWRLRHGPFARMPTARRNWTLLVQNVEAQVPAAAALLARFRFVPDVRLDDLMMSYAVAGGGVGPHVDSYDVFLLQTQGRRRWRIGRQRDLAEQPGLPLKILADFRPTQEWIVEPGDLLYLPPQVAHEGTAVDGDCITCSVGFRAPRLAQIAEHWFDAMGERAARSPPWHDPGLRPTRQPGRVPDAMIESIRDQLRRLQPDRAAATRALLTALSEPKPSVQFSPSAPSASLTPRGALQHVARRCQHGLRLDPRTRLLYARGQFAINGELIAPPRSAQPVLRALADRRQLDAAACAALDADTHALLTEWLEAGWLHPLAAERPR